MDFSAINTEKILLQQIAEGDAMAFRKLYDQYHQHLANYIFRLSRSTSETEEIVHDVFLKIWMTRESLGSIENAKAYLFTVSRNHALNAIKRRMRELAQNQKWQKEAHNHNQSAAETDDLLYSLIDQAIHQLPARQKKVFVLSRHERLTYEEIGIRMGISRETVKTYLQHATASITRYIKERAEILLVLLFFS